MRGPSKLRISASLLLVVAGVAAFPAYRAWLRTRNWMPVDKPTSVWTGSEEKLAFDVNTTADYIFAIQFDEYEYWKYSECREPNTSWTVQKNGVVIGAFDGWGEFYLHAGHYSLDVRMTSDGSCLQQFHPRVRVEAEHEDFSRGGWIYNAWFVASCLLCGIGIAFPIVGFSTSPKPRVPTPERLSVLDALKVRNESLRRRSYLTVNGPNVPLIGCLYALSCTSLTCIMIVGSVRWYSSAGGLRVHIPSHQKMKAAPITKESGLLVYVASDGALFFNSQPISQEDLAAAVEKELRVRPDRWVYVDADANVEYDEVIAAIDTIRGADGDVILATPQLRKEASQQASKAAE